MINLFQPSVGEEELQALSSIFSSQWIGKGEKVKQFEAEFASCLHAKDGHFMSTNACTEAIFLAPTLFDIGPGDEVIVPTISFIAVGNAIKSSGADIVFCDVDPRTLNICPSDFESKITSKTKAVFITHYGGYPCDMNAITKICKEHHLLLFEDAACSPFSFFDGKACGTFGDMGMWSFDAMKIITTGDGGMIHLASEAKLQQARSLLYLGVSSALNSGASLAKARDQWWEIEIDAFGRRSIMNDISAAIGLTQLQKLPNFLQRRRELTEWYSEQLSPLSSYLSTPPALAENHTSSHYFYWIQSDDRDRLARYLLDKGIYCSFRYWPLNKIALFGEQGQFTHTDTVSRRTLNLPVHQSVSSDNAKHIVDSITRFFTKDTKSKKSTRMENTECQS